MEKEIIEGNRLIAEFMEWTIEPGMEKDNDPYYNVPYKPGNIPAAFLLSKLRFITSWDWLMPVVEKIREIKKTTDYFDKLNRELSYALIAVDKNKVWLAVVDFIKFYNTQSK